ncbi:MAG: hypothetical protein WCO86_07645 [Planctomycetota bacterium]
MSHSIQSSVSPSLRLSSFLRSLFSHLPSRSRSRRRNVFQNLVTSEVLEQRQLLTVITELMLYEGMGVHKSLTGYDA